MAGQGCRQWLFDETFVTRMERYIQALLNHRNRYTGQAYRDEPAIAVFEVMNEPDYLDYAAVVGDPHNSRYRQAFDQWCAARGISEYQETYFPRVPLRTGPPGGGSPGQGHPRHGLAQARRVEPQLAADDPRT